MKKGWVDEQLIITFLPSEAKFLRQYLFFLFSRLINKLKWFIIRNNSAEIKHNFLWNLYYFIILFKYESAGPRKKLIWCGLRKLLLPLYCCHFPWSAPWVLFELSFFPEMQWGACSRARWQLRINLGS